MIITNKHALPAPLVQAITWDIQKREGFSVTDLINSPRITQLQRRSWDYIKQDASERIWILLGSATHYILKKGATPDGFTEERLQMTVAGVTVRGQPDLWHASVLTDYKVTSVWAIVFEPKGRNEWHKQLNLYNPLYAEAGFPTEKLQVCAILRDWQKTKVGERGYPTIPIVVIDIPIWPAPQCKEYLHERVRLHTEAENLADNDLPLCTPEDTWEKPTTYAVMKEGRQSAVRVFPEFNMAKVMLNRCDKHHYIIERPGTRVRCTQYCDVPAWCNQYKEYKCSAK